MAHGAGGKATQTLIEGLLVPAFDSGALGELGDAGKVSVDGVGLALTTDSFVVKPIRFPGGSIGELAVNGTVNDLAVAGARPLALTVSLVLEEGLRADELRAEVEAMAAAARAAGVEIVTGDTKVVERGHCDSMYVCTSGVGPDRPAREPRRRRRSSPATGCSSRARSASTARRSCSPAASSGWTPRSNPTRARCGRPSTRCSTRRARTALHARRDPRRGRHRSSTSSPAPRASRSGREADVPVLPEVDGRRRAAGHRPDVRRQRGRDRRLRRGRARGRGAGGAALDARVRAAPPRSARSGPSRPGWCWSRRRSAAGG